MKQAFLITGGEVDKPLLLKVFQSLDTDTIIVGIDGGCQYAYDAGIPLDCMIGDFDTLSEDTEDMLRSGGTKSIRLNPEKDMTDTHAAFDYLSKDGVERVLVAGAFGSRLDHSIANLMCGFNYIDRMEIIFVDRTNWIQLLEGPVEVCGNHELMERLGIGDFSYLSLLPLSSTHIRYGTGLRYPIEDRTFSTFDSIGVSNELTGELNLCAASGRFLLMRSSD